MARPSKYNQDIDERLCVLLAIGATRKMAAEAVGIHPETLNEWIRTRPPLAARVTQAEAQARTVLLANLYRQACNGSVRAGQWLLERLAPRDFGMPVQPLALSVSMGELPDDALDALVDGRRPAQLAPPGDGRTGTPPT